MRILDDDRHWDALDDRVEERLDVGQLSFGALALSHVLMGRNPPAVIFRTMDGVHDPSIGQTCCPFDSLARCEHRHQVPGMTLAVACKSPCGLPQIENIPNEGTELDLFR